MTCNQFYISTGIFLKGVIIFLGLFISIFARTQPIFPPEGEVFRNDVVPRIDIYIHPDTLQWIYNHVESDKEWRAHFVFDNGTIRDSVPEIGFRLRGNTSRYAAKKSFKVSFNTYHKKRTFHGLEKMNLNGEHNDPSVVRAKLCWDICRILEIPAPRSNHVRLFINGNFHGVYLHVEHIDEMFTQSRFGTQYGNLYKCLWPADLKYLGNNPELYKYSVNGRRAYELMTNRAYDDYSGLAEFIRILNTTSIALLSCELEKIFNVQEYLKVMAMDVFTGNWDGYIYNKNNFYLYHNPLSGQFEYIPYDLDNTFGIDWMNIDWGTRNIYQWAPSNQQSEPRPLYQRLLQVQRYRDMFSFYVDRISREIITDTFFAQMDQLKTKLLPYIAEDPFYPLDYGFTTSNFLQAYDHAWGGHVKYGIKPYIQTRKNSIQNQLQLKPIYPVANYLSVSHSGVGKPITFRVTVWDDQPDLKVWLRYRFDQMPFSMAMMDPWAGNQFVFTLTDIPPGTTVRYHLQAQDAQGKILYYPCETRSLYVAPTYTTGLYINEFMASNQQTIYDSKGEYEDWIELFNAGPHPVWLGDKYLSDDLSQPVKWKLPDLTLFPGEFVLIFADDEPEQGPLHASFRLSAEGESIGIFNNTNTGYTLVDYFHFGPQQTDISLGRYPDGSDSWVYFHLPTPGKTNQVQSITEPDCFYQNNGIQITNNPIKDNVLIFKNKVSGSLYHISGRKVLELYESSIVDVSGIPGGFYFFISNNAEVVKIIIP